MATSPGQCLLAVSGHHWSALSSDNRQSTLSELTNCRFPDNCSIGSRDSAVSIATGYGLYYEGVSECRSSSPVEGDVHTGSGAHSASYPMDKGAFSPWGKAAGA
jgi:hypothetical protein